MGDFNVDIKGGIIVNDIWKHIVEIQDLQQLIRKSTRVTAHSETLIDHLYVTNSDNVTECFGPIKIKNEFL